MNEDLPLTAEDIAEIAAIIEASPYRELDLSTRRFRLHLARGDGSETGLTQEWQWAGSAPEAAAAEAEQAADPDAISAPLPGTFYHAPQPGAPPFVAVGDQVGPETVVGIVETMKLMNPVHAGRAGRVAEVIVPNATMVAKGQPLIRLA
ncbi:biotin/lipoyl-containing protein [Novosphingobium sp.]|uniref:acetyl-CoA carboxylase biotin carboxyl carrier protein n=1 Tax=Novosphingobium sp. TaxID=1874826 RepID=UPI00260DE53F|nr:biotin/lipoyl-containing protein [Novosphingobium sp.]